MADYDLFINGIFRSVLEEILETQSVNPDHTLFLQPYKGVPIAMLRDNPPSVEDPVKLYASTSDELGSVSYTAEIVGWEDKTKLSQGRRAEVERSLDSLQPNEGGLYNYSSSGKSSLNLISIRRLVKLLNPFPVAELIKASDDKPYGIRSQPGGWSPVRKRDT